ncbi:hypothetical protein IDSA_03115 [Pseudidiomarina salinarum]|uniref:SecY interacting protein Syd n=1 Tax=Pseudidiomarina salinarum TaxID=435908 RepID=A0A094IVI5_9GAMM|nr:SecY-interacting protein Syd [Pseudidiomarina salinarum]KFZ31695.1 hypothetical protein IDSA_03115 [Pseudidiomarina salinarum]RUO70534.1 SecY-interacting protein Syd [Pseudidiomarina salinarum]
MTVLEKMDQLLEAYQQFYADNDRPLLVEANPEWQAPIYGEPAGDDWVRWQPILQSTPLDFGDLTNALEQPFHPDLMAFYSRWFAADLAVTWQQHPLWLLQVHGPEDGDRLLSNQAGHVLMKRRLKQPITLFIGLAEETDDLLLTMDNETGAVGLEFAGREQHEVLAPNLAEFLENLSPRLVDN